MTTTMRARRQRRVNRAEEPTRAVIYVRLSRAKTGDSRADADRNTEVGLETQRAGCDRVIAARGGTVIYGAMYPHDFEMPLNLSDYLYLRELTLTGLFVSPYAFPYTGIAAPLTIRASGPRSQRTTAAIAAGATQVE